MDGLKDLIWPTHDRVVLWDNNILGLPAWREIFQELAELGLEVDINQGLDARILTDEVAESLRAIKIPRIRVAYDYNGVGPYLERALERLEAVGISPRSVIVYTLYNYIETPEDFLNRVREILSWGAVSYPMRFEPLTSLTKNAYVSPQWTKEELEMVAVARRVMGFSGAFPPYKALRRKLEKARDFQEGFELRPATPISERAPAKKKNSRFGGSLDWRETVKAQ